MSHILNRIFQYNTHVVTDRLILIRINQIKVPELRGGIKKNQFFFGVSPKGGEGGLAESKISLAEKTEIFLDFFWQKGGKGGGVSPIPKGFYHKILIFFIKYRVFFGIFRKFIQNGNYGHPLGENPKKSQFFC